MTNCIENNIRQGCGAEASELVHRLVKPMVRRSGSCTYGVYHHDTQVICIILKSMIYIVLFLFSFSISHSCKLYRVKPLLIAIVTSMEKKQLPHCEERVTSFNVLNLESKCAYVL